MPVRVRVALPRLLQLPLHQLLRSERAAAVTAKQLRVALQLTLLGLHLVSLHLGLQLPLVLLHQA